VPPTLSAKKIPLNLKKKSAKRGKKKIKIAKKKYQKEPLFFETPFLH
jgi:hypothetical protein